MSGYDLLVTPQVSDVLEQKAVVAIGVSGGKDSCAVALAVNDHLDRVGHTGPRILLHADLGSVEWKDSYPTCQRLALATGLELVVVQRKAGGMMDRWLGRWHNNVERYRNLECVKLILPWSTAGLRFCTSEQKSNPIRAELARRFPGHTILSVTGIRREESSRRAKAVVFDPVPKLERKPKGCLTETRIYDWHPLLDWSKETVFGYLEAQGFALHEAYTTYHSSRVSCAFCILASQADLRASATCPDNQAIYRTMVELEIASTFSFQSDHWLGDVAPHLLARSVLTRLKEAKERALIRELAEKRIPPHLLYSKGWPSVLPNPEEAELLCQIRRTVASAVGLEIGYDSPAELLERYGELLELARSKGIPQLWEAGAGRNETGQLRLF